jgi:hypothetical protein
MLERFNIGNARILASATTTGQQFVTGFRLQRNAKPLDTGRVAGFVEFYAGNADA